MTTYNLELIDGTTYKGKKPRISPATWNKKRKAEPTLSLDISDTYTLAVATERVKSLYEVEE